MISFNIELNGVKVSKSIPSSWDYITFDQYLKILNLDKGNEVDLLSMFTGIEPETIRKAKITGLDKLLSVLDFLKEQPQFTDHPDVFMGRTIPKDITFEALGPYIDCRQILFSVQEQGIAAFVEAYAKYCAIYCQSIDTNWTGYDNAKALELLPEVYKQPAREVVGLGSFFITRLLRLKPSTATKSPKKATRPKKLKRATRS